MNTDRDGQRPLTNTHEQHQVVTQQFNEIGLQPRREINPRRQADLPMMQHQLKLKQVK